VITDKSQFSEKGVCDPNSAYSPSGASTLYGEAKRAGSQVTVEAVDFAQWFDDLVRTRYWGEEMKIVLKIDAEGAEKAILEKMTQKDASDAICKVKKLWMEYHYNIFKEGTAEYDEHLLFKDTFPSAFEKKCGKKLNIGGWF